MDNFERLWDSLLPIGRCEATGGYRRYAWTDADLACRDWFTEQARRRGLTTETDRNGNQWAWWGEPGPGAVVTGSHLDSVPDGGAYDGPLGVVSAFAALDLLRDRGVNPRRPVAVAALADEEGARFGVACVGSRLATGALDPDTARALRDADGVTLAEAMRRAGHDSTALGRDDRRLAHLGAFVELHIEQGRALADLGAPVGVAAAIWPHGRWRLDFTGAADHAGTTRLADRRDPMLPFAHTVIAARRLAAQSDAVATIGKVRVVPGGTNAIPSAVHAWLDARAPAEQTVDQLVADLTEAARAAAADHRVAVSVTRESWTPVVAFHAGLRDRVDRLLAGRPAGRAGQVREPSPLPAPAPTQPPTQAPTQAPTLAPAPTQAPMPMQAPAPTQAPAPKLPAMPVLATGAGHDAGILAAVVPTAMLFVRNVTGVSHAPAEHADRADCLAGVEALAAVLEDLACRTPIR